VFDASIFIDPHFQVGPVHPRTFGSFVEHMGRCVYTGVYEPGHPTADEDGFRGDVLDLTREMGVTTIRYPGGNFVSNFRWEDSIGPVAERPARLELAWRSLETNQFGLHEFIRWCERAGVEPMMAVNLGTRGPQHALELLEYCNHPAGSQLSDLRRANGAEKPFGVKMWCLGNEMDGRWQVGHATADEYGRLAAKTASAMLMIDSSLELVACGSSSSVMPTFGSWEATVLDHTYEYVDFISAHAYYQERDGDLPSFLASAVNMDSFITSVTATADHIAAKKRLKKKINISFDEWNVWYLDRLQAMGNRDEWTAGRRLVEDEYNVADAVVVGNLLISLLRHSDRVTAASIAQLVNMIAPIKTEPAGPAWRQTTFYPFALTARHASGVVLRTAITTPVVETTVYGEVPAVDSVVTCDEEAGSLSVFVVNRHLDADARFSIDLRAFPGYHVVEHVVLSDPDVRATNTLEQPERVVPRRVEGSTSDAAGSTEVLLPPMSWSLIRLNAA